MTRIWSYRLASFDWLALGSFLVLILAGLATIWGIGDLARPFFYRQLWFFALGGVVVFCFSLLDYRIFRHYSLPSMAVYIFSILLLLIALGSKSIRGINAWISLGGFRLEPSEFAKIAIIILLAKYFSQKHVEIYRVRHLIASGLYVGLPVLIILLQPDLGSAFILVVIWLAMLLAAGIKRKHLLVIILVATLAGAGGWFSVLKDYQKNRIVSFLNPYLDPKGEGYSIIQSKIAVGAGGLGGSGWGQGTQARFGFLPEAHTDFVFAAFAEQFGLWGVGMILATIWLLIFRLGRIGFRRGNNFSKLFSVGFITFIFSHVAINAGMNLGLLPITGVSFPFLSYGGSFMIALSSGLGIMESISLRG